MKIRGTDLSGEWCYGEKIDCNHEKISSSNTRKFGSYSQDEDNLEVEVPSVFLPMLGSTDTERRSSLLSISNRYWLGEDEQCPIGKNFWT